jgi:hypothetical protein
VESRMSKVTCSVLRLVIPKNKCVKKKKGNGGRERKIET